MFYLSYKDALRRVLLTNRNNTQRKVIIFILKKCKKRDVFAPLTYTFQLETLKLNGARHSDGSGVGVVDWRGNQGLTFAWYAEDVTVERQHPVAYAS